MLPNQFPPSQCSSYFTQWLISEYLNRVNEQKSEDQPSPDHLQQPPPPPPKTPPPTPNHQNHHHQPFSAKHLKHLFTQHTSKHHHSSSSSTHHSNNRPNNNEYKNGLSSSHHSSGSSSATSPSSPEASITHPKNIEFIQLLALNALEFTAPIYSFLNKKQQQQQQQSSRESEATTKKKNTEGVKPVKCPSTRTFVQLSGHPGSFAPAGPNTVWKKMPEDQGGAVCGRDQLAGNTLRVLLEGLNINGESTAPLHTGPQESTPTPSSSTDTTTPITVFFNSSESTTTTTTTSTSTSSSSTNPPLLPPQIFSIPTHLLPNETQVYRNVNSTSPPDSLIKIIPKYVTETCYCSQMFLELEDLLTNFSHSNPTIMDIKLGTRTFLESEVQNSKPRPDLYQKLISVDPSACTDQEHEEKAVTKLTYMLFREKQSSSNSLGFRVEGVKIGENGKYDPATQLDDINFKVLRNEDRITMVFKRFCKNSVDIAKKFLKRLEFIRETLESSEFFMTHEVIGSSLLFIHDDDHVGIWLIDFAKTFQVPGNGRLTHRTLWKLGNREDGVLTGVDSTIRLFRRVVRELDER